MIATKTQSVSSPAVTSTPVVDELKTSTVKQPVSNKVLTMTPDNDLSMIINSNKQMAHLPSPASYSANEFDALLSFLSEKISSKTMTGQEKSIAFQREKISNANKSLQTKLSKIIKQRETMKTTALVTKIFSWIGAVFTLLAGIVTSVLGGAGTALIVAGIAAIALNALNESGGMEKMNKALTTALTKHLVSKGIPPKKAKELANIYAAVIISTAVVAVSVGSVAGAGKASTQITSTISKQVMKAVMQAMTTTEGLLAVTEGSLEIGKGVLDFRLTNEMAQKMKLETGIKQSEFMLDDAMSAIEKQAQVDQVLQEKVNKIIQENINLSEKLVKKN